KIPDAAIHYRVGTFRRAHNIDSTNSSDGFLNERTREPLLYLEPQTWILKWRNRKRLDVLRQRISAANRLVTLGKAAHRDDHYDQCCCSQLHFHYLATRLTSRRGTTMVFAIVRPSSFAFTRSLASTA